MGRTAAAVILLVLSGCRGGEDEPLRAWGTVEARTVEVASRSQARVAQMLVEEGDSVRAGQVLVSLYMPELEAERAQAAAAAAAAGAELRLLEAGSRTEDVVAARQALTAAQDRLGQARRDAERARTLVEQNAIATRTEQNARTRVEVAEAEVRSARAQLQKLASGARAQEIEAAAAQQAQAEAGVRLRDELLRDRELAAPADGVILDRLGEPGEVVLPGRPLLRVGEIGRPYLDVYVPEPRMGDVRAGAEVRVEVDAFPGRQFAGRVRQVAARAEFTPKNVQTADQRARLVFRVRVDVLDAEDRLLIGMPGAVLFSGAARAQGP